MPDYVTETFEPGTEWGGHDGKDRSIRWLRWRTDPDPSDETYVMDFAYLFHDAGGSMRLDGERHVCGVFPDATWRALLGKAGFEEIRSVDVHVGEPVGSRAFLARRPRQ